LPGAGTAGVALPVAGVGKDIVIQVLYGIVAIEGYFKFERVLSLQTHFFRFRLLQILNRRCHDE
jgi:hypothetical protein